MIEPNLKTLLTKLNYTGLAQKQPDLYQFLHDLFLGVQKINANLVDLNTIVTGGGGGSSSVTNIITQQLIDLGGDSDGGGGDVIPGPAGITGAIGPTGPAGITSIIMMQEDGIDGESIAIPGSIGPTGATGATGATGLTGSPIYIEPETPDDPMLIPGQQGIQGIQGIQGPLGPVMFPEDGSDNMEMVLLQQSVASSNFTGSFSPLTDGDFLEPELVFADGNTIAVWQP